MLAVTLATLCACATTREPELPLDDGSAPLAAPRERPPLRELVHAAAPPPMRALAELPRCNAQLSLVDADAVRFEGDVVASLVRARLRAHGPAGLKVELRGISTELPDYGPVALPPKVALRLPAGPAHDEPAGQSGALFDLGGLAIAGFVNLVALPFTLPLSIFTGPQVLGVIDPPVFTEAMFADVVVDDAAYQAEVERRAAPYARELAAEGERQKRFALWRDSLRLEAQEHSCTVDASGACALDVLWPGTSARVAFTGEACPPPPPPPSPSTPPPTSEPAEPDAVAPSSPPEVSSDEASSEPELLWAYLPTTAQPAAPFLLEPPPRPGSDHRGEGAQATRG